MFAKVLWRSLKARRQRLATAVMAILLGAAMVSALLTVTWDIKGEMGRELRSYGANLLLLPRDGGTIETEGLRIDDPAVADYAPYLYSVVDIGGRDVILAGTWFDGARRIAPWWKVTGRWAETDGEAMVGARAARELGVGIGGTLEIGGRPFKVAGIVETGSSEESQVFVGLEEAQLITGERGASLIQARALGDPRQAAELLEGRLGVRAKEVRQISESEALLLGKMQLLLALVTASVLGASTLAVAATMLTSVLEREREVGLMRALGAGSRHVAYIFLAEASILGVVGGLLGYLLGLVLVWFLGRAIFGSPLPIEPVVLPITILASLAVALVGSLPPVRRALEVDPAVTLRGD